MIKKKKTFKKSAFIQGFSVLLLAGLAMLLTSVIWMPYFVSRPIPSFELSPSMEEAFINKFAQGADVNKAITLHVSSFYDSPTLLRLGNC